MELEELKSLWSACDEKLNENLKLNHRILNEINLNKTKSHMRKILIRRIIETLWFLVVNIALWYFIAVNLSFSAPVISAFILNIFTMIGLAGSIGQIALIKSIDYSGSVTSIQKQFSRIKSHSLQVLKLLFLSVPFNMAYMFLGFKLFLGIDMFEYGDTKWLISQFTISFCLIFPTIWLYKQFSKKGPTNKWIKMVIADAGGEKQIASAVKFLNEIENFEKEDN